jgi:hypothetical protein
MNDYQFDALAVMLNAIQAEIQKQTELLTSIREHLIK